ncbi:exopolyphosphatase/guanosine-5'-triphosphate,3'-diphosphate pyrophosphatase [Azospirillum brasilense]|uniref:Exopolyphosphatase/guanosine-5'-triphosphate, 3'-diphosphate pyrophosphatase n=1 Tax=Azospirillum brasilense TaxID=192 RepID=A0A560BSP6_AZOBR|nr:Ppx/GppA phosphatase family protein [Azospirillum brasilense]MBK3731549.1 Ppx/GppA family phosphatase [Azospirillum brasilense]TWA75627.1 exopolyphosphatase/guanosine-5'-triphosphate,3'-diphosphate pyrophosphatase [Azospirillum brasilense]
MDLQVHSERQNDTGRLRSSAPARPVFAALDLGTNNCRLLIARPIPGGFRVIDAFSRIVRLGEGLTRNDRLSDSAMERTLTALKICGSKIERRGVTAARAVATEACRRARNCSEFIDAVERETGIAIEIISSQEEGRLALAGCASLLDPNVPYAVVFDIGGGSTELMWLAVERGRPPRILDQTSIQCGVIGLTEQFGGADADRGMYRRMVEEVASAIASFEERNGIRERVLAGQVQMLGTSGTVTTLAGVHLGLCRYDRRAVDGSFLRIDHARAVIERLVALDFDGRARHPCIGQDRADLVIAGCAVLDALCDCWPVERLRIADRGLREGILVELIGSTRQIY